MTPIKTFSRISMAGMAAVVGVMTFAGSADARTFYYGDNITFREAKRLCAGINGRVFLSSRDVYACTSDEVAKNPPPRRPVPPAGIEEPDGPIVIKKTSSTAKRQNFTGRRVFENEPNGGGNGNGGGSGGGGSAGGRP